jgi:hypothetical protein
MVVMAKLMQLGEREGSTAKAAGNGTRMKRKEEAIEKATAHTLSGSRSVLARFDSCGVGCLEAASSKLQAGA